MFFSGVIVVFLCMISQSVSTPPLDSEQLEAACVNIEQNGQYYRPETLDQIPDVLPTIFGYLNIQDLTAARRVCTSFRQNADEELLRRSFQIEIVKIAKTFEGLPAKPISKILRIEPKLSLFFTTGESTRRFRYDTYREWSDHYLEVMPPGSGMAYVEGLSVTLHDQNIRAMDNNVVGIFFPDKERSLKKVYLTNATIDPYNAPEGDEDGMEYVENVVEQLIYPPHPNVEAIGLIIFHMQIRPSISDIIDDGLNYYAPIVTREIKRLFESKKFALWGANVDALYSLGLTSDPLYPTLSFGMSLSGPGVQSWSVVIDVRKPEREIKRKLKEFRNRIEYNPFKAVALSLQYTTKTEEIHQRLAKNAIFSSIFPDLQIMGYGTRERFPIYCSDSTDDSATEQTLKYYDHYACYMILSYV